MKQRWAVEFITENSFIILKAYLDCYDLREIYICWNYNTTRLIDCNFITIVNVTVILGLQYYEDDKL